MSIGLEVYDEQGDIILNTNSQTTSVLGSINIQNAGVYRVINQNFNLGTPFYLTDEFYNGIDIVANFDGDTYTFEIKKLPLGSSRAFNIIYGVY
ncbi:MAG: hypothetical protein Q4G13_08585 [Moraxella sp.]|nr:hypothetical protein [Moraxella sp.]